MKNVCVLFMLVSFSILPSSAQEVSLRAIDVSPVRSCCAPIRYIRELPVQEKEEEAKFEGSLKITDPELSTEVSTSPNPTKGPISVNVPANLIGETILILDMSGRLIADPIKIQNTLEPLTIEGESGIYLMVIRTEKETITKRILLETN